MASSLSQVIASIQLGNYATLSLSTAVAYDYVLTFSSEVEYVWSKPWTKVSWLFVLARYFGLGFVLVGSLWGSSSFPVSEKVMRVQVANIETPRLTLTTDVCFVHSLTTKFRIGSPLTYSCEATLTLLNWFNLVFWCAAEWVMILRLWALYNHSRIVLWILLIPYALEVVSFTITCVLFVVHSDIDAATAQVLDFSFCVQNYSPTVSDLLSIGAKIALGVIMCSLFIVRFVAESLQMYRATKQIQLNHYINLLLREGIVYFLAILCYAIFGMMADLETIPLSGWGLVLIATMEYILPYTLVPRFVLNLRELYARDLQGRRGSEIDTAFGLSSTVAVGQLGAVRSVIVFADALQNSSSEEQEEDEEIQMEERGTRGASDDTLSTADMTSRSPNTKAEMHDGDEFFEGISLSTST